MPNPRPTRRLRDHATLLSALALGVAALAAWPRGAAGAASPLPRAPRIDRGDAVASTALPAVADRTPAPAAAGDAAVRVALVDAPTVRTELVVAGSDTSLGFFPHGLREALGPRVRYEALPDSIAVEHVLAGLADVAITCVPLERLAADPTLREQRLGDFVPALVRHPDNPIADLGRAQLRGIHAGAVRDWSEIGGAAAPIHAFSTAHRPEADGLEPGDAPPTRDRVVRGVDDAEILALVQRDPCAIGLVSLASLGDRARAMTIDGIAPSEWSHREGAYPFGYTVRVVHRAAPDERVERFLRELFGMRGRELLAARLCM